MSEPETPRRFVFPASLPVTGTVVRRYGNGRVRLTLEVPESHQDIAACVGALIDCHFRVTVALAALPAEALYFGGRLPTTGMVDRGMGDGSTWLILEADKDDQAAASAVRKLTKCALLVTVEVDDHDGGDLPAAGDAPPAPRRIVPTRRVVGRDPGL